MLSYEVPFPAENLYSFYVDVKKEGSKKRKKGRKRKEGKKGGKERKKEWGEGGRKERKRKKP